MTHKIFQHLPKTKLYFPNNGSLNTILSKLYPELKLENIFPYP